VTCVTPLCPTQATAAATAAAGVIQGTISTVQQGPGAATAGMQPADLHGAGGALSSLDSRLAVRARRPVQQGQVALQGAADTSRGPTVRAGGADDWGEERLGEDLLPM
jgi:hypothetical protein